jgi:hypothetical protein
MKNGEPQMFYYWCVVGNEVGWIRYRGLKNHEWFVAAFALVNSTCTVRAGSFRGVAFWRPQ